MPQFKLHAVQNPGPEGKSDSVLTDMAADYIGQMPMPTSYKTY